MIKEFKEFNEDVSSGVACSTGMTSGMGNVVSAPVGQFAGVPAGSGSGDIGFGLGTYTKKPVSDSPSKVSDLRYLKKPRKGKIKKVKDM